MKQHRHSKTRQRTKKKQTSHQHHANAVPPHKVFRSSVVEFIVLTALYRRANASVEPDASAEHW